jgi:putative Ca2+/H+ antiporter (TMEM165/GDT1 family)
MVRLALIVAATSLLGELPDKTMLAAVVLGRRHHPLRVIGAAALGLGAQALVAAEVASLARRLFHASAVHTASAIVLLVAAAAMAYLALRRRVDTEAVPSPATPFYRLVGVFFLAELGDVTQATTAGFALSSGEPVLVALAATLGMTAAISAGATLGSTLQRIPERALYASAALVLTVLGVGQLVGLFAI